MKSAKVGVGRSERMHDSKNYGLSSGDCWSETRKSRLTHFIVAQLLYFSNVILQHKFCTYLNPSHNLFFFVITAQGKLWPGCTETP